MAKAIQFRNKNNEKIYPCPYYPVGSIYQSTSSTNPTTYFGGVWECIYKDYEYIYLGSQVVHPGVQGINVAGGTSVKTVLQGAYSGQFNGLESNITCPPGYQLKYRWSMEVTTDGNINCCLKINNKQVTNAIGTWSNNQFRQTAIGGFFKLGTDIAPASTSDIGYSTNGYVYSLYTINNSSGSQNASVWDVTAHLYAVSKNIVYKWRRIS